MFNAYKVTTHSACALSSRPPSRADGESRTSSRLLNRMSLYRVQTNATNRRFIYISHSFDEPRNRCVLPPPLSFVIFYGVRFVSPIFWAATAIIHLFCSPLCSSAFLLHCLINITGVFGATPATRAHGVSESAGRKNRGYERGEAIRIFRSSLRPRLKLN